MLGFSGSVIQASGASSSSLFYSGGADAQGQLSVTYTYTAATATPEPATMLLFGSALVGLSVLRKRVRI